MTSQAIVESLLRPLLGVGFVVAGYSRLVRAITRSILLPSTVIGRNHRLLEQCVKEFKVKSLRKLRLGGLDCATIFANSDKHDKGWIVYVNANGVCYEHILRYTEFLGNFFKRKVMVFNYSGVGYSSGMCNGAKDMERDLRTVLEYVFQDVLNNVPSNVKHPVLIWGHSIGGAVTMLTASDFHKQEHMPSMCLVLDRSFGHLEDVVKEKISIGPLAPLISGVLISSLTLAITVAALVGFNTHPWLSSANMDEDSRNLCDVSRAVVSGASVALVAVRLGSERPWVIPFSIGFFAQIFAGNYWLKSSWQLDSLPVILLNTFALAFELAQRGVFHPILLGIVASQGWVMNPRKALQSIEENGKIAKIVVTFHEEDEMISPPYSMRAALPYANCHLVTLDGPMEQNSNHMYDLNLHELEQIKELLGV